VSETIAGYTIEEELGRDAWGRAYRAHQVSLDRPVYLTLLDDEPGRASLARACAALTHPHLVSGIDFGEIKAGRYLVMEWIEGPTLGDVVRRGGPIAEERALSIGIAVAGALDYAVTNGIYHGSVGPEAIIITSGGSAKLTACGPELEPALFDEDYRSPEQKRKQERDGRSDLYSLGATLYFALSARHPLEGAPPAEVVDGEVRDVPFPLGAANRRLRPEVVTLVDRLMAWDPDHRFATAGEAVQAMEQLVARLEEQVSLRPTRPARTGTRRQKSVRPRRRRRR
jgi:serine/threonine-protein kinase